MIILSLVLLRIKTLRSFWNLDFLASFGCFNGTWIEYLEIKMFIARNSSGERFIQSDLLKSNFSNEVMGGLIHLA